MSTSRKKDANVAAGRRLMLARTNLGLTRQQAADLMDVSVETYRQHENGTSGMGRNADTYAAKYDVPKVWLLHGERPPDWLREEGGHATPKGAPHHLGAWRVHRRMTPEVLASEVGASVELYVRWERDEVPVSTGWLARLAEALEATPGMVLDVDPAHVAPALLETWMAIVQEQPERARQTAALRVA